MDIGKLVQKLSASNSPVSLRDFTRVADHFGYILDHVSGSHHVFRSWTGKKFVVPVHRKKVKAVYIKLFLKEQK